MASFSSKRSFTPAAREAALAARRAKALEPYDITMLEVFVVRCASLPMPFSWEIRRFGGIVVDRSDTPFPSTIQAKIAGERVLAEISPS